MKHAVKWLISGLILLESACKQAAWQDRRGVINKAQPPEAVGKASFRKASPSELLKEEIRYLRQDLQEFRLSADLSEKSPDDQFMDGLIQNVLEKSDEEITQIISSPEYSQIQKEADRLFSMESEKEESNAGETGEKKDTPDGVQNPLTSFFGGQYNEYNGSLLLLSLGLVGIVNGLGEAAFGQKAHGAVAAGIGLALLVAAKKVSEGEPSDDLKAVSGGLVMANSLLSLTGAAIFLSKSRQMVSNMNPQQKLEFSEWMNRFGVLGPEKPTDFSAADWQDWKKNDVTLNDKLSTHLGKNAESRVEFTVKATGAVLGVYAVIGAGLAIKRLFDGYSTLKSVKEGEKSLKLAEVQRYDEAGQQIIRQLNYRAKRLEILRKLADEATPSP